MSKNMTISEGCTAFYTKIDDKFLDQMTGVEVENLINHLAEQLKIQLLQGTVSINSVIELFQYENYESDGDACDQCGDVVTRTHYVI